jgi:3-isopropylmalate/(R)-2-methylmalate dehydratase large subunit
VGARTLFEKIWDAHVVAAPANEPTILYVDLHLIHEVTSPQAFDGLRLARRTVHRADRTLATADHNVPTDALTFPVSDPVSLRQLEVLEENCAEFNITLFPRGHENQGIVHVIGPELGVSQPGMVIVCGDSHTSTHGAFASLAFGIGTSEVEHVLATQTIAQQRAKTMAVTVDGTLSEDVSAKDVALAIIARLGTGGGSGYVIEYRGSLIRSLSMEARMTICNMSIEAGARAGLVAVDETTVEYLRGRPGVAHGDEFETTATRWREMVSDEDAVFDHEVVIDAGDLAPFMTWGTNPAQVVRVDGAVPTPMSEADHRALAYMDLTEGQRLSETAVDVVFIGSCTNSRIEDLRAAADIARRGHVANGVRALVVPGSQRVKAQAEREGLDQIFLGMNPDQLKPGQRSASTSNRNFEGRQGRGGRTHLVSPAVAAATAVFGRFALPSEVS